MLVAGQRGLEIPARDVDVPAQRLGPRRERRPALASHPDERRVERRRGGVQLAGEELHATEHRQRVGDTTPVAGALAEVARLGQRVRGARVVGGVAADRTEDRADPPPLGGIGRREAQSPREPGLGPLVAGLQELDVAELAGGRGRRGVQPVALGDRERLVQRGRRLLVASP